MEGSVSTRTALIAMCVAALVGVGMTAAVSLATHKGTHNLRHHGIGDSGDADAFIHPFLAEVDGTHRESFVAYGFWGGQPYWHSAPEHRDTDSHNHLNIHLGSVRERDTFASVRSPVTGLAHHHHTCGNGDCSIASGSAEE
jgi:hypothetical protein